MNSANFSNVTAQNTVPPHLTSTSLRCRSATPIPPAVRNATKIKLADRQTTRLSAKLGFHQERLQASQPTEKLPPLDVLVRAAESDEELQALAALRAVSFYAYPPEREFAGMRHQLMMEEQELQNLKKLRTDQRLASNAAAGGSGCDPPAERIVPLVAMYDAAQLPGGGNPRFALASSGKSVAGTCDLAAVKALAGEVLVGNSMHPAYLANMCVAAEARRRDVGGQLLAEARALAREWGVDGLYVHTMAANSQALAFYEAGGFKVVAEESSNRAHYRGRCLDGIEGAGRTVLLQDMLF